MADNIPHPDNMITKQYHAPTLGQIYTFPAIVNLNGYKTAYKQNTPLKLPYHFIYDNALIGIEIELENYLHPIDVETFWEIKTDGSLRNNGIEFVSHPLRTRFVPYALQYLCDELFKENEPTFSNRTSVHIHLNVRDFSKERLKVFLLLYCIFEKHFFNVAGTKRENNIFCVPLYKTEQPINLKYFDNAVKHWNKYNALNLACILGSAEESIKKYGTVEFRHLYGTLDPIILYPWIDSILHLRQASLDWKLKDLEEVLINLNTTSEYYAIYKKTFKARCLNFRLITQHDFESCILHTKLNYFSENNLINSPESNQIV